MNEVKVVPNRVNVYTTVIHMVFIAAVAVVFNFLIFLYAGRKKQAA
jgi:hypothetical protein